MDLAQLGRMEGSARPVGFEKAFYDKRVEGQTAQKQQDTADADDEDEDESEGNDFMAGYELDLGGLGEKPSSVLVEDIVGPREEVPSEDDGPEDFTQNMEGWMRGTKKWPKEQRMDEDIAEGHDPDPDPEQDLELIAGNGIADESVFEPQGTSTPAPLKNHAIIEEGVEEEARLQAPPLSRLNTEMLQDKAAEEVFDRISALQAEVESMRMEDEARRAAHEALEMEHENMRNEYESARQHDQIRYNALREVHEKLERTQSDSREALGRENKSLTQEYNNAMEQLRSVKNQIAPDQETGSGSLNAKYQPANQELEAFKAQAELDRSFANSEIERLTRELEAAREDTTSHKSRIDLIQKTHSIAIKNLEAELEARRKEVALDRKESIDRANEVASLAENNAQKEKEATELIGDMNAIKMELRNGREQLQETRRIVKSIEDENDQLVQQNQRQAENIAELEAVVKSRVAAEATTEPIKDRQSMVDQATHKTAIEALSHQHHTTLTSLGAEHGKELQTLRKALLKAGEGLRKREAKLKKSHEDQVTSLNQQITSLTQQLFKISNPSEATERELRSAIRVLNTKLEKANASAESSRLEAADARQQAEDIQQANAIVNAELESRFAETIEAREKEWRRRIDLLFREREKMGKALMWGWGREEVGAMKVGDGGQGYRYVYERRG